MALAFFLLLLPGVARGEVELAGEYSMLGAAVERFDDDLAEHQMVLNTQLTEEFGERLVATNDVPDFAASPGYLPPAVPESVSAPSVWGDWAEFDFGPRYGVVRFRLVGRGAGTGGEVDGVAAVHEDSFRGYGDSVVLVSGRAIEDFVVIPAAERAEDVVLRYEFQLPAGAQLVERDSVIAIVSEAGVDLIRIAQPEVQDSAGNTFDAQLSVEDEQLVLRFAADAHGAVGDLLVDPQFGNPTLGEWTYKVCSSAGASACAVGSNTFYAGWAGNTSSGNYRVQQSTSAWGTYIGVAATAIEYTARATMRWTAPRGTVIDRINSAMTTNTATNRFECRSEMGNSTAANYASSWVSTDEGTFGGTINPGAGQAWAGFAMQLNQTSGSFTPGTADSHRCYNKDSTDFQTFTLFDGLGPTAPAPESAGQAELSTSLQYTEGGVPGPWYGPTSSKKVAWEVSDRGVNTSGGPEAAAGSGVAAITIVTNADGTGEQAGSTGYNVVNGVSLCTPGTYGNQRPCLPEFDSASGPHTLGNWSGLVTGSNTMRFTFWDYSDRAVVTAVSKFRYDETPPNIAEIDPMPTYVGPNTVNGSGDLHITGELRDSSAQSGVRDWTLTATGPNGSSTACSGTAAGMSGDDWSCDWNVTNVVNGAHVLNSGHANGTYTFTFKGYDNVGNMSQWVRTAVVDFGASAAPSVAYTQPANGPLKLSWIGTDTHSGIAGYYVCSGITITHCDDRDENYSYKTTSYLESWAPPRNYYARAYSRDGAGNLGATSSLASTLVEPRLPSIPTAPTISQLSGETALLSWGAVAPSLVGQVGVVGYETCIGTTTTWCNDASHFSSWASPSPSMTAELTSGTYYARVRAVDEFGGESAASGLSDPFTIDGTPPAVSLDPVSASLRQDASVSLSATATDSSNSVAGVRFERRKAGEGWTTISTDASSPYEATLATSALTSDGAYQVRAVATDAPYGNAASTAPQDMCLDRATLAQPSDVKQRLIGNPVTGAEIWWTQPSTMTGVSGYLVERRDDSSSPWQLVSIVPRDINSIADETTASTVEYRVEAVGELCSTTMRGNGTAAVADTAGSTEQVPANEARIGLEDHWTYYDEPLGGGASLSVNVAGGNAVITKPLPAASGRGFDTAPVLTYNAQDPVRHDSDVSGSGIGTGWTLGLDALAPTDGITGFTGIALEPLAKTSSSVTLRDADGTPHVFDNPTAGVYDAPAGAWLYLRDINVTNEVAPSFAAAAQYAATRPDRVTYWYAGHDTAQLPALDGRLLAITDRNGDVLAEGAQLRMSYECVEVDPATGDITLAGAGLCSGYSPQAGNVLRHRLAGVVDAESRTLAFGYFDESANSSEGNRDGLLESITDFAGVEHTLQYDQLGADRNDPARLNVIREAEGTTAQRDTGFQHGYADNTRTRWSDESHLVTGVVDPRSNATTIKYALLDGEYLPRVTSVTDRYDATHGHEDTTLTYGVEGGVLDGTSKLRAEDNLGETYTFDVLGRVVRTVTAMGVRTRTSYTATNRVSAVHTLEREDEAITLSGTSGVALAETVIPAGMEVVVRSAPNQLGVRYEAGTDYALTSDPGTLARTATGAITSGATVYVTYVYTSTQTTWDPTTGLILSAANAAPQRQSGGSRIAATPGEMASPTVTTYTNTALGGHVADVHTQTSPRGTATPGDSDDFQTTFTYNTDLLMTSTTAPINVGDGEASNLATRTYVYNADGTLASETDANDVIRKVGAYDATGQPQVAYETVKVADAASARPERVTIFDEMGRSICVDEKLEAGDSVSTPPSSNACVTSSTNETFSTVQYDELGRSTVSTTPWDASRRRAAKSSYDANGNVTTTVEDIGYTPGSSTPASPDNGTEGATTTEVHDSLDRAIRTELPANDQAGTERIETSHYDVADNLIREMAPLGTATENASDYAMSYTYDADGRGKSTKNGNGEVTCTWYDAYGRAIATSQPMAIALNAECPTVPPSNFVSTIEYDRAGNAISTTDVTGRKTESYFDDEDNVVRDEDAAGAALTYQLSADGDALVTTAPAAVVCTDAVACATTSSESAQLSASYDDEGQLTSETSAREGHEGAALSSHETEYEYDLDGNVKTVALPAVIAADEKQAFQHTSYTDLGDVASTTIQTPDAGVSTVDANEKSTWVTGPDGSITGKTDAATGTSYDVTYDVNGQLKSKTEHGVTTSWSYFPDGSVKLEVRHKLKPVWQANRTYAAGECIAAPNNVTFMVIEPGVAGATAPSWPSSGQVAANGVTYLADECTETTTYTYDRNGQQQSTTQQSSAGTIQSKVLRRDNTGRVLDELGANDPATTADDDQVRTTTVFNRNGQESSRIQNGRKTEFEYGTSGSTSGLMTGEQIGYVGASPELAADFAYDTQARLKTIIRNPNGSAPLRTDLTYDAAGNMTRLASCTLATSCDAVTPQLVQDVRYTPDLAGNIRVKTELLRQLGATAFTASKVLTSGDVGKVVTPTTANGHQYIVMNAGTTGASQPSWPTAAGATVTSGTVTLRELTTRTEYAYDAQNRMVFEDRADDPATDEDYDRKYVYDANGRLDRIENEDCTSGDAVAEQYSYDDAGQTSQVTERKLYSFSPAQGACVATEDVDTTIEFGEANSSQEGAITQVVEDETPGVAGGDEKTEFEQNEANMLTAVTTDGETKVVTLDSDARPIEETSPNGSGGVEEADLTYAGDDRNAATIAEVGDPVARGQLTAPNGWLIAEHREPSGYDRYYLTDHLGTPVSEFSRSGSQVGTYAYDPYGAEDPLHTSGAMTTTIGFAGERADAATGLTNHDARDYSAELRVWVTTDQYSDPSEDLGLSLDPANSSRMQYGGGNPINNTDPDGHMILTAGGKISHVQIAGGSVFHFSKRYGSHYTGRASSGGVSAAVRHQQNLKASAARWRASPAVVAMDQRRKAREADRARRTKSCQNSGGKMNTKTWKCSPAPTTKPKKFVYAATRFEGLGVRMPNKCPQRCNAVMSQTGTNRVANNPHLVPPRRMSDSVGAACDAYGLAGGNPWAAAACTAFSVVPADQSGTHRAFNRASRQNGCVYWPAQNHKFNDGHEPRVMRGNASECWSPR